MVVASAMPPFARALRVVLGGALLTMFDVRLDGVDLLPDLPGHVLVGLGCLAGLPHRAELPPVGRAATWLLAGATVLALAGELLGLLAPGVATWSPALTELRAVLGTVALLVLGRAAAGVWLPRHAGRWQFSLVSYLIVEAVALLTWLGGQALEAGWRSPGAGWLGAPIALALAAVGVVSTLAILYSALSSLWALGRVRAGAHLAPAA